MVADENGVVVDVNDAGCALFGRPREELVGLHLAPHSRPEVLRELGERWPEMQASGSLSGPARIARSDGESRTVEYTAQVDLPIRRWTLVRLREVGGGAST